MTPGFFVLRTIGNGGLGDDIEEDWHTKSRVTVEVSEDVLTGKSSGANKGVVSVLMFPDKNPMANMLLIAVKPASNRSVHCMST